MLVGVVAMVGCSDLGGQGENAFPVGSSSRFGDAPDPTELRSVIARAAETAERAGTGRYVMRTEHGEYPTPDLTGTFDASAGSVQAELAVGGEVWMADLVVHGVQYAFVRSEGRTSVGLTTPWVLLDDTDELAPVNGEWGPFALLDSLRGQTGNTEVVGTEPVDGEPNTRFRVEVIASDAARSLAPALAERLRGGFGNRFDTPVDVDLWVDSSDHVRRIRAPWSTGIGTVPLVAELHDLGASIQIDAPPDAEVTNLSDLDLPNGRADIFAPGGR